MAGAEDEARKRGLAGYFGTSDTRVPLKERAQLGVCVRVHVKAANSPSFTHAVTLTQRKHREHVTRPLNGGPRKIESC